MFKNLLIDYFSFTRKERMGVLALLSLILFFTTLPFIFNYFVPPKITDHAAFEKEIAALEIKNRDSSNLFVDQNTNDENQRHYYPENKKGNFNKEIKGTLFNFDPNTLETAGWKKLGVRDRTITTIQNYLVKGGRFYQPADIAKIWGLREDEIQRLLPFVSIPPKHTAAKSEEKNGVYQPYIKKENKIIPFDINIADTTAFIALPGIGSKLAARIISYREKLGGFYRIEQVAETFALPDSTYRQIKKYLVVNQPSIKKININSATIDEMKIHPYIRYSLAAAIYQYRTQHGNFVSPSDIKKIMMVTEEDYNRLAAYIIVQ